MIREAAAADGSEKAGVCQTIRRLQATCMARSEPASQDMGSAIESSEVAQQFMCSEKSVAGCFVLPLKQMLYRYICSLRTLLSCPLEEISQLYPAVRLLQSEQQQLQRISSAQSKLPCLSTAVAASVHGSCTPSSSPSSENISPVSLDDSGSLSEDPPFSSCSSVPVASIVNKNILQKTPCDFAVLLWKPFAVHITNILEAENLDDLLPYVEVFEPCLQAAVSPADLTPQACALLCAALRHVEKSGFSVSAFRRQQKVAKDGTVPGAVASQYTHAVRASASEEAAPVSTVPYSAAAPFSCAAFPFCSGAQLDRRSLLHVTSEKRALHTARGERQSVSARMHVLHTCSEQQHVMPRAGGGTISKIDTGNTLMVDPKEDNFSSSSTGISCVITSAPAGKGHGNDFSLNASFVADSGGRKCFSRARAESCGEDEVHPEADTETTTLNYDLPLPPNRSACYRNRVNKNIHLASSGYRRWLGVTDHYSQKREAHRIAALKQVGKRNFDLPNEKASNEKQEAYTGLVTGPPNPFTETIFQGAGYHNGGVQFRNDWAFFRVDTIEDPLLAKALERAKLVCLQHLHWLRQLVPSWSGKAYQVHMAAILGACDLADLTIYLIIFANLEPDVENQFPVTVASLMECLEELQIVQHGYASSALPRGLLHSSTTLATAEAFALGNSYCTARTTAPESCESVSSFPLASPAPVTSPTVATATSAVLSLSRNIPAKRSSRWGCPFPANMCDPVSLPLSEQQVARGLLSYLQGQRRLTRSGTHCRDAAAAVTTTQQSSIAATSCSHICRMNCQSKAVGLAASQSCEPVLPSRPTGGRCSDFGSLQVYEREIEACLNRVVVDGDSWLLHPLNADRSAASADGNCWNITGGIGSSDCSVEAEKHGSCIPFKKCKNGSSQRKSISDSWKQQGNTSFGRKSLRWAADGADSKNSKEKSRTETSDDNASGEAPGVIHCKSKDAAKRAATSGGLLLKNADCLLKSASKDSQRHGRVFLNRESREQRNDYIAELLLLLEDPQLPCPLQEQLYAEVLQYVSAPSVSQAQWKQIVWQEAHQRRQEEQMLLQLRKPQRQAAEEKASKWHQRHWPGGIVENAAGKQYSQHSGVLDKVSVGKENEVTRGHKRRRFERQNRRSRKRRHISGKSARAGKKLSTRNITVAVYARLKGERQSSQASVEGSKEAKAFCDMRISRTLRRQI